MFFQLVLPHTKPFQRKCRAFWGGCLCEEGLVLKRGGEKGERKERVERKEREKREKGERGGKEREEKERNKL